MPSHGHVGVDGVPGGAIVAVPGEQDGEPADEVAEDDSTEAAAGPDNQRDRDGTAGRARRRSSILRRISGGRCTR